MFLRWLTLISLHFRRRWNHFNSIFLEIRAYVAKLGGKLGIVPLQALFSSIVAIRGTTVKTWRATILVEVWRWSRGTLQQVCVEHACILDYMPVNRIFIFRSIFYFYYHSRLLRILFRFIYSLSFNIDIALGSRGIWMHWHLNWVLAVTFGKLFQIPTVFANSSLFLLLNSRIAFINKLIAFIFLVIGSFAI